jgi:large subunit ribosomal protein L21
MFAVIKTGGKQYRVAAEDVITIDKVKGEPGEIIEFPDVLLLGGDSVQMGNPTVGGASVAGEVVDQGRGAKIIAFKKRRRKNSRRKRGHRQEFTVVRITEILTEGRKPTPRPKAEARPRPQPQGTEEPAAGDEDTMPAAPRKKAAPKAKTAAKKPAEKPKTAKKPAKAAARTARSKPTDKGRKK